MHVKWLSRCAGTPKLSEPTAKFSALVPRSCFMNIRRGLQGLTVVSPQTRGLIECNSKSVRSLRQCSGFWGVFVCKLLYYILWYQIENRSCTTFVSYRRTKYKFTAVIHRMYEFWRDALLKKWGNSITKLVVRLCDWLVSRCFGADLYWTVFGLCFGRLIALRRLCRWLCACCKLWYRESCVDLENKRSWNST
jgi:hypothetical protein